MCAEAWRVERTVGMETHILRHMEQCMPTTQMNPQTPDNEVARLQAETDRLYIVAQEASESAQRKTNEVARLREILNRALECLKVYGGGLGVEAAKQISEELAPAPEEPCKHETKHLMLLGSHWHWCSRCGAAQRLVDGKPFGNWQVPNKLAPAPEEPLSDWKCPHCGSTTGTWFSRVEPMGDFCEDCGKAVDEEPAPEWRELGPYEVIQEGDEVFSLGMWIPVSPNLVIPINDWRTPEVRFRTRRPLPKPIKIEGVKKQEMPLEGDIASIEWSCAHTARAIRYLRDEIQKLKQTKTRPRLIGPF